MAPMLRPAGILVIAGVLATASAARAEPAGGFASNSVFAQLVGAAQTYTLNAERRVVDEVFARVGLSYGEAQDIEWVRRSDRAAMIPGAKLWQFPIVLSYLGIRHHRHGLELGAGGAITYVAHAGPTDGAGAYFQGCVGYRYQSPGRVSFQFRIGAEVFYGSVEPHQFAVGAAPYLSVGAAF